MNSVLPGCEPKRLWDFFIQLSAIPRTSKHEEKAAAFVLKCARSKGLDAFQDVKGNVLVRKPASPGLESAVSIVLQSHLDMVGEKNRDTVHDFLHDPIELVKNGDYLSARGTTLGADNGIGVATSLAIMEDSSLTHGPMEFLFTVDEEAGLNGALNVQKDFLQSRILINLDSEEEGVICVGCAGGGDTVGSLKVAFEDAPANYVFMNLVVNGLSGGHSGLEIHSGRGNAIKIIGRVLSELVKKNIRLCSIQGGNKRNAIPRECEATIAVPEKMVHAIELKLADLEDLFKSELEVVDHGVELSCRVVKTKNRGMLTSASQKKLISLVNACPHGVSAMSQEIAGLVETSTNCAKIYMAGSTVVIETSQRSSRETRKQEIMQAVKSLFILAGANVKNGDGYPGWRPDLDSLILKTAQKSYKKLYGKNPKIEAVHAGLECGIIGKKYPDMDMISIGPTMEMVHSPEERVHIGSVKRYWDFLIVVLGRVAEGGKVVFSP